VAALPADASVDTPPPDAFSCASNKLQCGESCVDPMTTAAHCGSCDTSCDTAHEACTAGHCVDAYASCATIHAFDPTQQSGLYTILDGTKVFCDMDHPEVQYDGVAINQFDSNPAGYDLVNPMNLGTPGGQLAFVTFMNAQGGATPITTFTVGNCCFKFDGGTMVWGFGAGAYVYPATVSPLASSCGGTMMAGTKYTFATSNGATLVGLPIANNYFTVNPPTGIADCSTSTNPAFFWRKHP
jgi:hypothetical protein